MTACTEFVASVMPFTVRRTVRWAECDPAGVVYAGRYVDYLLDTCALFFQHIGFGHGQRWAEGKSVGLPAKHIGLTFMASLFPDEVFDMTLAVTAIRTRTFDLSLVARRPDGEIVFEGQCSPICIAPNVRESVPMPDQLRQQLSPYLMQKDPS